MMGMRHPRSVFAKPMPSIPGWALFFGLMLLCGCAVGPRYSRPSAPVPTDYKETPQNWKPAQPSDEALRGKWWEVYQDQELNTLEDRINISNQSLKTAQAQFAQARATVRYNRADYYPTITAGVSAAREHLSENRPLASGVTTTNDLIIPVDMSYEPDVWGRVRRTVEAARAQAQIKAAQADTSDLITGGTREELLTLDAQLSKARNARDADQRKAAIEAIQKRYFEEAPYAYAGQYFQPMAYRTDRLKGLVGLVSPVYWNAQKIAG